MHSIKRWCSVLMLAFFVQSCEHKELCFDHSHLVDVDIVFDWSAAPDATPQTMVVQFFRMDGSSYYRGEFTPSGNGTVNKGRVRIETGEYKILFHNGEMASVSERGNTYDSYELTTLSESLLGPIGRGELGMPPRPSEGDGQPVRGVPENVWGGLHKHLEVLPGVSGQSITLSPSEVTIECTVEVRNVKNMSDALDLSGALTGMSESWCLADGVSSGLPVTMPIALRRVNDHTLEAHFVSFGHCPVQEGKHIFSIYTSNKKYYNFDVTDQMHDKEINPDMKHIQIVIDDEVDLPSPDGGMSPSVSEWDEVITDIEMN